MQFDSYLQKKTVRVPCKKEEKERKYISQQKPKAIDFYS